MNDTQIQKLIEAIQKSKAKLSWLPFWYAGFFFTIGYNWAEASEIAARCSLWQNVLNGWL